MTMRSPKIQWRAALYLALALLVVPIPGNPAWAQANPAFFGHWASAGDNNPDIVITPNLVENIGWGSNRYEVVRDMGDRVLMLEWPTEEQANPALPSPAAYTFVLLVLFEESWRPGFWYLNYAHCGVSTGLADRFNISSREGIWDQLLAPNGLCELKDDGHEFGYGWGQVFYIRKKRKN